MDYKTLPNPLNSMKAIVSCTSQLQLPLSYFNEQRHSYH